MEFRGFILGLLLIAIAFTNASPKPKHKTETNRDKEEQLTNYLKDVYEIEASKILYKQVVAEWNLATDVSNKSKEEEQERQTLSTAKFTKETWEKYFKGLKPDQFSDPVLKREVFFLSILGTAALDDKKLSKLTSLETKMSNIYSTAKICPYDNKVCDDTTKEGLSLDPEIEEVLATSTDYDELEYVWTEWRRASGKKMREDYKKYVDLSNEAARLNGYKDMGEMWRSHYESETFIEDMDALWEEVKPLYDELHTYVFAKLKERYPQIPKNEHLIPAHILGNMWAQSWVYLYDLVKPFPNASEFDVTKALKEQGYNAHKMFETADEFYKSLGLEPNDVCYNVSAGAIIEKPEDRDIVCHASAWDFYNGKDYRVKMCTKINQEDFITIHHEMGHIQYYLLYKNQPISLRSGANPGFHEAVGDTIALSVSTPDHLKTIGLLPDFEPSKESSINALMQMALERVAFLPFGLLIDKWRWDVFSGDVTQKEWNNRWWHYREKIQRVKAPNKRTDEDFDPGAKYHVPGNSQYIAYFVAHLLEFQMHRALCIEAGQYDPNNSDSAPLHKCDIYNSKAAGEKLRAGLSLGASKHWTEALFAMTGERKQSGAALLEYFQPLHEFLQEENRKLQNPERHMSGEEISKETPVVKESNKVVPLAIAGVIGILAIVGIVGYVIFRRRKQ